VQSALSILVLASFAFGFARADDSPPAALHDFAQRYGDALKARDVAKIQSFFLPGDLVGKTAHERAVIRHWNRDFKAGLLPASAPVQIFTQTLKPKGEFMAQGDWKATPQYSIEVMSLGKPKPGESEAVVESVTERGGRFYIVRPMPKSRNGPRLKEATV